MAETPSYRVMSVDPKMGDIDEQFALIETERGFGAPASDPSMRKIVVGDSLPEGEVTAITGEGIQVIPEEGDEYVIPLGGREGYKPPVREKTPSMDDAFKIPDEMLESFQIRDPSQRLLPVDDEEEKALRMEKLSEAAQQQGQFYDTDDPNEIFDLVQEDFQDAFDNQKQIEMTQTPEGTFFLFQDEDGGLSRYFVDEENEAIRTSPKDGQVAMLQPPVSPMSVFERLIEKNYIF